MASLLSFLGSGVKRVANTVNNDVIAPIQRDVVQPAQAAVAQANPLDNGRTAVTVMTHGAQYAPQRPASVVHQVTHNGAANFAGNNFVKPILATPLELGNQAYNHIVAPTFHLPHQSVQDAFGKRVTNFTGATNSPLKAAGDTAQTTLTIGTAGLGPVVERGLGSAAGRVGIKALPKVVAKPLTGAITGGVVGGPYNVAANVSAGQPITKQNVVKNLKQGAEFGAALGAGGEALGLAAPAVKNAAVKGAKAATKEPPAVLELRAKKAANIKAMDTAKPTMMKNLVANVNSLDSQIKAIKEGGYAKVPGAKGQTPPEQPKVPQGKVPQRQISAQPQTNPTSAVAPLKAAVKQPALLPEKLQPKTQPILQTPRKGQVIPYNNNTPLGQVVPLKQSKFTQSVKTSDQVSSQVRGQVSGKYATRSTADLAANAEKLAGGNLKTATTKVNSALDTKIGSISDQNVADAIAVAKAHDAKGNFDQAQHIYDKLAEHGTKGGQQIQAFSLLSNRTPAGMNFQAIRALKKAGIELDKQGHHELQSHIENVKKTVAGTPERDMALHQLVQFVNDRIPSHIGDKVVNFWRAGLLTSPVTTGGNILGNTTEAATRNLWSNPVAAAADKAMSLVTGQRTKTLTGGQAQGTKYGLGQAKTYLKTGFDPRNPSAKFDAKQVNYNNKAINTYVNGVYRWMGGQDQPFYYAAQRQAARDLATADAKNLKLTGQAKTDYISQAEANPSWEPQTFKSKSNAETAGRYAVYQNDTLMGHIAAGAKNYATQHSGVGGAIANFLLPFTQVPASVAMRIIDRTPIGIAKEVASQLTHKSFDQRAMAEAIGNGTFAPGVIFAGAKLAQAGQITGAYPTDPKEQELWKSEGKQPFSVKVGNRWYSLNYMQPFGTLLAIGGQVHNDTKNGASPQEAWGAAGATAAKSVESQSFLQGINGVLSAVNDPQRSAGQYITSTSSSVVPNIFRTTARATDPFQRDAKGVINGVKGAIPGVRETLPQKQDMFGKGLPAVDNTANQLLNPFRPSIAKTNDSVVNELRRLQDTQNGIIPTQYNKSTIKGVKLNDQQVRQLQSDVGGQVHDAWKQIMADPRYKALSDADKATALKKAMDAIGGAGKAQFQANNNMIPDKGLKLSSDIKSVLNGNQPDYLTKASSIGTSLSPKLSSQDKTILNKYASTTDRTKAFNTDNAAEYQYNLAKHNNDRLNGTLTQAQDVKAQDSLAKQKVGADYSKNVRDLYGLSKAQLSDYLATSDGKTDKQALATQLKAYDQALVDAGIISKGKFATGIAPSKSGRKSSGTRTASTRAAKAKTVSLASYRASNIKTPSAPNIKVGASNAPKFKSVSLKQYRLQKSKIA